MISKWVRVSNVCIIDNAHYAPNFIINLTHTDNWGETERVYTFTKMRQLLEERSLLTNIKSFHMIKINHRPSVVSGNLVFAKTTGRQKEATGRRKWNLHRKYFFNNLHSTNFYDFNTNFHFAVHPAYEH